MTALLGFTQPDLGKPVPFIIEKGTESTLTDVPSGGRKLGPGKDGDLPLVPQQAHRVFSLSDRHLLLG